MKASRAFFIQSGSFLSLVVGSLACLRTSMCRRITKTCRGEDRSDFLASRGGKFSMAVGFGEAWDRSDLPDDISIFTELTRESLLTNSVYA